MQAAKWLLMGSELEKLTQMVQSLTRRLERLENNKDQEIVTLVEILATATFFGQLKKALCQYAKDGQCSLYIIDGKTREQLPFTTPCEINDCKEQSCHSHLKLSNLTCGLCHETAAGEPFDNNFKPNLNARTKRTEKLW